jgi:2-oxoglutarate dehydrogenase complex dehydrogenase (E1) component-like enzyme
MASFKTRALAVTAAVAILGSSVASAPAFAHKGMGPGKVTAAEKVTKVTERLTSFLSELVKEGTITQAQADAIIAAKKVGLDARAAKFAEFQAKAKPLIAAAHGLSVADYEAQRAARTLTKLTAEQRKALKAELTKLAQSLGLDGTPKGVMRR